MSVNSFFGPQMSESGGTIGGGPFDTGTASNFLTGNFSGPELFPNTLSSGVPFGRSGASGDTDNIMNAFSWDPKVSTRHTQITPNPRVFHARTCSILPEGMQVENCQYHLLFMNKDYPSQPGAWRDFQYPSLEARRTLMIEEVFTLPQMNYMLYRHQRSLHEELERNVGLASDKAYDTLDEYEQWFARTYAFCGAGMTDMRLGHRVDEASRFARAQKRINTVVAGYADVFDVFESQPLPKATPFFFLLRQIEYEEVPTTYTFTQNQTEAVRDERTGEFIGVRFRPYQLIPFAKQDINCVSLQDRHFVRDDGEEHFAPVIRIGTMKTPKKNVPRYTPRSKDCWFDSLSCMQQQQITINIDPSAKGSYVNPSRLTYRQELEATS